MIENSQNNKKYFPVIDPQKNSKSHSSMGLKYLKVMEVAPEPHTSSPSSLRGQVATEGSSLELQRDVQKDGPNVA